MSLTEYEETTARKTGVGPYTVHYDGWGSMAVQTMGNAGTWQMLECDAVGVVTASQAIVGSSLIGVLGMRTDYKDYPGNEAYSGCHTNSSDIMCLFGPKGSELDPTATTLSEDHKVEYLKAPGAVNFFRIVRDQNAFFGFRLKFHLEFKVKIITTRKKEKCIKLITGDYGTFDKWDAFVQSKFKQKDIAQYGFIDMLRASLPDIPGSRSFLPSACHSHASAFLINYTALTEENCYIPPITHSELSDFHNGRYRNGNANLMDTGDVQALSDNFGEGGLQIRDTYQEIENRDQYANYLSEIYRGAGLISNNKPYIYSYVTANYGHAEVVIGHRYTEVETSLYHIIIDSEDGIRVHHLGTNFKITEYEQIRFRNFSAPSIKHILIFECDINRYKYSNIKLKEYDIWMSTRKGSKYWNRGFICGFTDVLSKVKK